VDGRISEIGFGFGRIVSGRGLKMWKVKKKEKRKPEMKKKRKKEKRKKQGEEEEEERGVEFGR
jgi:hypothetical protein